MAPSNAARGTDRRVIGAGRLRVVPVVLGALLALVTAQYLAGVLLLLSLRLSPASATPLTVAKYLHYFGDRPRLRARILWCSGIGLVVVGAVAVAVLRPKAPPLYGAASFASRSEIARAGLLGSEGILLGEIRGRYLTLPGQQGVMLAAPPRSGKGVGIVVPNLLHFSGSAVITDIKRENWTLTAGYRASRGQAVFLFDPLSEHGATARWNPLSYVSETPAGRINDLQRIADMIFVETPGTDPFWVASARSLFVGIGLYLFETAGRPRTIGEILRQGMASDEEGFGAHWRRVVEGRQSGRYPLSAECVRALYDVIDLAPVTASSIRKTFTSRLDLWQSPLLDAATSGDDFDLRDLRRHCMTIYVAVNPDDLHRLRPVLSLFFQQTLGLQTRTLPEHDPTLRYQVLMLMDEFAALGKIPIMAEAIAYLPGYNVRTVLVVQTPAQLREVYGQHNAETMTKSLAVRIVYSPKDNEDAKEISDLLGTQTVRARSVSKPKFFGFANHDRAQVTVSEQKRPLLLPQEVRELGPQRALIFYEGVKPILARKIRYYADPRFKSRLLPAPAQPAIAFNDLALRSPPQVPCPAPAAPSARPAPPMQPVEEDVDVAVAADPEVPRIREPEGESWTEEELKTAVDEFLKGFIRG